MMPDSLPIVPFTRPVAGNAKVPGSKSITNRALLMASLTEGSVILRGALFSEDVAVMETALNTLGIETQTSELNQTIKVDGQGGMIPVSQANIQVGNAGTVARFLTAALALRWGGSYQLDGADAMTKRPMRG
ncbi:uncharacterized protein METZ01_LOCUS261187, partial [marine metagenome]